jgi:hypothetical protein
MSFLISLLQAGGIVLAVAIVAGVVGLILVLFWLVLIVRFGMWLWSALPILETLVYRQRLEWRGQWSEHRQARIGAHADRQDRRWGSCLTVGYVGGAIIVATIGLLLAGQPSAWLVLGVGGLIVGLMLLTAWV